MREGAGVVRGRDETPLRIGCSDRLSDEDRCGGVGAAWGRRPNQLGAARASRREPERGAPPIDHKVLWEIPSDPGPH